MSPLEQMMAMAAEESAIVSRMCKGQDSRHGMRKERTGDKPLPFSNSLAGRRRETCYPAILFMRMTGLSIRKISRETGINRGVIHYVIKRHL